jgi:voltage-gated potassium channel Kch
LGRGVIAGDIADEAILLEAGIHRAVALALTIPDEKASLSAIERARRLEPGLYIIACTTHASTGMKAHQLGANQVITAEQVVAEQVSRHLQAELRARAQSAVQRSL